MVKKELMKIDLKYFGLPAQRRFPMHDEAHLKSAIGYFHTCKLKDRAELAKNIIRRHSELKSDIRVSKKNPLYKYVPENMRKASVTESVVTESVLEMIQPVFMLECDRDLVKMLIDNVKLETVDDLDKAVALEYPNRTKLLAAMKSAIMFDEYPVSYNTFPVIKNMNILTENNGGISLIESCSMVKYDNSKNTIAKIDPVKNYDHIQFCTLLREWAVEYNQGYRNRVNDALMINSWVKNVKAICEAEDISHSEANYQKLLDLGIDNTDIDTINTIVDNVNNEVDDIDIPISVSANSDSDSISITTTIGKDGTMFASMTKGANDDFEKYK